MEKAYRNGAAFACSPSELDFSSEARSESGADSDEGLFLIRDIDWIVEAEEGVMLDCTLPEVLACF